MVLQQNRKILFAVLLAGLAACQKNETQTNNASTPASAAPVAATTAAGPNTAPAAAANKVAIGQMDPDQLRQAALTAMSENRLYSPSGDNAIEYYLALHDKLPNDPNVSGALIDLAPYTAIAIGQSLSRNDFAEAQRLTDLVAKIDANYPALPRLRQNIADAQDAFQKKQAQATAEQQRLAQQQAADQQKAAQQKAAAAAPAPVVAAPPKQVEEPKPVAVAPAPAPTPVVQPSQTQPEPTRAAPVATELVVVSAPSPRYPAEALSQNISGEVLLELTVGTDGSVSDARVVRSTPPRVFDREALTAVKKWKFAPIDRPTITRRTINFKAK